MLHVAVRGGAAKYARYTQEVLRPAHDTLVIDAMSVDQSVGFQGTTFVATFKTNLQAHFRQHLVHFPGSRCKGKCVLATHPKNMRDGVKRTMWTRTDDDRHGNWTNGGALRPDVVEEVEELFPRRGPCAAYHLTRGALDFARATMVMQRRVVPTENASCYVD